MSMLRLGGAAVAAAILSVCVSAMALPAGSKDQAPAAPATPAPAAPAAPNAQLEIRLSPDQLNMIARGLAELPYKDAAPIFAELQKQLAGGAQPERPHAKFDKPDAAPAAPQAPAPAALAPEK